MIYYQSLIPAPASNREGEPFPCPHCGQMLARSCRVCVACKKAVEPPGIAPPQPTQLLSEPVAAAVPPAVPERVRYPWALLVLTFLLLMAAFGVLEPRLGPEKSQMVLYGVEVLTAVWVFYDAQSKGVPKALRWGLGTLLFWPFIFPWYLARRRKPAARCPFVEGPAGRFTRALLVVLLLVLFILVIKNSMGK